MKSQRWAVFISGRGSNLQAILSSQSFSRHRVVLVVSSKKSCLGVDKARRAGIPVFFSAKGEWQKLQEVLRSYQVQRIFLAGFMRILPRDFTESWSKRTLNVHPSLLPAYPGLNSIERAFAEESDIGVTVHEVIAEVDSGKNILQRRVVKGKKRPSRLEEAEFAVHCQEHRLVRKAFERWVGCA